MESTATAVESEVDDLLRHAGGIEPTDRHPPRVHDVDSYVTERVTQQITSYYRPQAAVQQRRFTRVRWASTALALVGGARRWGRDVGGRFDRRLGARDHDAGGRRGCPRGCGALRVPVGRDLRTAVELERLRDRRARGRETDDEAFIKACEHVISVKNEGWMAKLTSAGDAAEA